MRDSSLAINSLSALDAQANNDSPAVVRDRGLSWSTISFWINVALPSIGREFIISQADRCVLWNRYTCDPFSMKWFQYLLRSSSSFRSPSFISVNKSQFVVTNRIFEKTSSPQSLRNSSMLRRRLLGTRLSVIRCRYRIPDRWMPLWYLLRALITKNQRNGRMTNVSSNQSAIPRKISISVRKVSSKPGVSMNETSKSWQGFWQRTTLLACVQDSRLSPTCISSEPVATLINWV